jgi:hypothetical protein
MSVPEQLRLAVSRAREANVAWKHEWPADEAPGVNDAHQIIDRVRAEAKAEVIADDRSY